MDCHEHTLPVYGCLKCNENNFYPMSNSEEVLRTEIERLNTRILELKSAFDIAIESRDLWKKRYEELSSLEKWYEPSNHEFLCLADRAKADNEKLRGLLAECAEWMENVAGIREVGPSGPLLSRILTVLENK